VSGFGTGATPPAFAATSLVNHTSISTYGSQPSVPEELYVATRGGNDQQIYALNFSRFATLDVLENIYNMRVDTNYWDQGIPKNTVPNLFEYLLGFMVSPS